jgi:CheY-like chemotaxis protein
MFVAADLQSEMNAVIGKSKTVLVVAKQPNEIAYFTKHLSIAGYTILFAQTGAGAIKITKEHAADIVILEVDLSDIDGIDVVRAIRENPEKAGTPIIAVSAFPYVKAKCLDNGCNGFVQKPIKVLDLLTALRKLTKG